MVKVLKWKYSHGEDDLLDYIASSVDFNGRDDIASDFDVSVKTIGRWMKKLRDESKLVIHRYENNEFVYMIGKDAEECWNKREALEIYGYRNGVESSIKEPIDKYAPIYNRIKNTPELDVIVDKLIKDIKSTTKSV